MPFITLHNDSKIYLENSPLFIDVKHPFYLYFLIYLFQCLPFPLGVISALI